MKKKLVIALFLVTFAVFGGLITAKKHAAKKLVKSPPTVVTLQNNTNKNLSFITSTGTKSSDSIIITPGATQCVTIKSGFTICWYGSDIQKTANISWKTWLASDQNKFFVIDPLQVFTVSFENLSPNSSLMLFEKRDKIVRPAFSTENNITNIFIPLAPTHAKRIQVIGSIESSFYLEKTMPNKKKKRSKDYSMFELSQKVWTLNAQGEFLDLKDMIINASVTVVNNTKNLIHFRVDKTKKTIATIAPESTAVVTLNKIPSSTMFSLNPEDSGPANHKLRTGKGYGDLPSRAYRAIYFDGGTWTAFADKTFDLTPATQS